MRWSAALSAVVLLCAGAAWTLRLGYADYLFSKGTRNGIEQARRLAPGKAEYFARKAEGEDSSPIARAVELNPYFSRGWIELALEAELSGRPARAEQFLREASRRDRSYLPRWSLANFYFRTGNREQFWVWARRAAEMGPYDQSALFELCWRMSGDAGEILAKAIPADPAILSQYLNYLLRKDRLEAARGAAEALARLAGSPHRAAVLYACDRLLAASRVREAVELWNMLAARKLIPYPSLTEQTSLLTNGDFNQVPVPGGFDWKVPRVPGVSARGPGQPPGLSLDFSGTQPHRCELAAQALPVEGGQRYRVLYSYRTRGIRPETGLRWAVGPLGGKPGWWAQGPHLSREEWGEESFEFLAPPGEQGARLVLLYERAVGTTRIEGTLHLRRIQVSRVEPR